MITRLSVVIFLLVLACVPSVKGQTSATGLPYFQQHVHYTLDATFNDDATSPTVSGAGALDYTNNSPDTLREIYFHLYWNLFQHGSYGESAPNRDHSEDQEYGHGGITVSRWGATDPDVHEIDVNQYNAPRVSVDNTIARMTLDRPLLPGHRLRISFEWSGLLPNYGIRSTWGWHDGGARNFSTAQWYPQVCVYDNHGWHPDQYVGMGEFYTDYGAFDVTLHVPERFTTVVSTGWQKNQEMLPDSVQTRLAFARSHPDSVVRIADYSNFVHKSISQTEPKKTWVFHADSVRDFAWCADEAYIWDAAYANGIMHHSLYWANSREFWQREATKIAVLTITTNSRFAGQYIYPNAFMCETYEGGMEYPGIVFIGPYSSGEQYHYAQNTMMHELGHEWYPMMMGSNETDYAWMDEGFNTFITTFVMESYFGRYNNSFGPGLGFNDDERTSNYSDALMQQLSGEQEPSMQKAETYRSYHDYANATYPHPSAVFFMLRYTMGERAFDDFMHLYYDRWKTKHPYPGDLLNAAEDIERREGDTNRVRARGDLRWFFDEWLGKTWKCDYAVGSFSVHGNEATVRVDKLERAVMPIDLVFTLDDGSTEQKWVPVDDWLRTVANERTYTFALRGHARSVTINPSNDILDINRLNNSSGLLPPMQVDLMPKLFGDIKPIDKYAVRSAPFLAPTSGGSDLTLVYGWTLLGSYLGRTDRLALGVRLDKNTFNGGSVGEVLQYHSVLDWLSPWTDIDLTAIHASQTEYYALRLAQTVTHAGSSEPIHIFQVGYDVSGTVLFHDTGWLPTRPLNRISGGYTFVASPGSHSFAVAAQAEAGLGDPQTVYSKLALTASDRLYLTRNWNVYLRAFAGSMQPNGGSIPSQTLFHLASSSDVDHYEDLYATNFGTGVRDKIRNATLSGPLVRGYFGQDVAGRVGASASLELSNRNLWPFSVIKYVPYLGDALDLFGLSFFADAGLVTNAFCTCNLKDDLRSDAGAGLRLLGEGWLNRALNLDLSRTEARLDFPVWLSNPATGENRWAFRVVGVLRQNF